MIDTAHNIDSFLNNIMDKVYGGHEYSYNTLAAYKYDIKQFLNFLAGEDSKPEALLLVSSEILDKYISDLQAQGYNINSIIRKWVPVKKMFTIMHDQGIIQENPTTTITVDKPDMTGNVWLSDDELSLLSKAANEAISPIEIRDWLIVDLLCNSGLKAGHIVAINIEDIDMEKAIIKYGPYHARSVTLEPEQRDFLWRYIMEGRPHLGVNKQHIHALLINQKGGRLSRQWVWNIIKKCGCVAGIKKEITPEILRRSYGMHLLRTGASVSEVQNKMGHSGASTIYRYKHMDVGDVNGNAEIFVKASG